MIYPVIRAVDLDADLGEALNEDEGLPYIAAQAIPAVNQHVLQHAPGLTVDLVNGVELFPVESAPAHRITIGAQKSPVPDLLVAF
ncbi:MAG: hypothetical protein R2824_29685 [Saprospiraceae bacterium]|nr:hypothetical protein [Lewinella sp.]